MKVCFFNTNFAWGGGERWHFDMAKSLHNKGFDISVVSHPNGKLNETAKQESFHQYSVKLSNLSFLNPLKIFRIYFLLKKLKPDVIILNLPRDLKSAGIAAKLAGIKHIIYRRGSAIPINNKSFNRFLFKNIITAIIANSEETKRTILKHNPSLFSLEKIYVIYNGIDIQPFDNLPEKENPENFVIGNLGRLVEQKGQKYLIQLAEILKSKKITFIIIIGGDGELEGELKSLAKQKNVDDCIEFSGLVNDVPQFMNQLDVFVLTSLWEGFGYVLAEAMAAKKPVLAFHVSSNPELIIDGENGFLIEDKNIEALAEKIILLNQNQKIKNELGNKGRKIVEEQFTREKSLANLENLLHTLCPGS